MFSCPESQSFRFPEQYALKRSLKRWSLQKTYFLSFNSEPPPVAVIPWRMLAELRADAPEAIWNVLAEVLESRLSEFPQVYTRVLPRPNSLQKDVKSGSIVWARPGFDSDILELLAHTDGGENFGAEPAIDDLLRDFSLTNFADATAGLVYVFLIQEDSAAGDWHMLRFVARGAEK